MRKEWRPGVFEAKRLLVDFRDNALCVGDVLER
jgi:hypothetical protein